MWTLMRFVWLFSDLAEYDRWCGFGCGGELTVTRCEGEWRRPHREPRAPGQPQVKKRFLWAGWAKKRPGIFFSPRFHFYKIDCTREE